MSGEISYEKRGDILWGTATGDRDMDTIMKYSAEVMAGCAREKTPRVLIDVRGLKGQLSSIEVFDLPSTYFLKIRDRSVLTHLAMIDFPESQDQLSFLEYAAKSRGLNIRVFIDVEEALLWLKEDG